MTTTYIYCNEEVFENDGSDHYVKKTVKRYLASVGSDEVNATDKIKDQVVRLSRIYKDVRTTTTPPQ